MNDRIPPEFEQIRPDGRMSDRGRSVDNSLAAPTGAEGTGPGYGYGVDNAATSDPDMGLIHYVQIVYKRRYVALSAFLLVVLGGALSTFTATRIYEGTVNVLIEREGAQRRRLPGGDEPERDF